MNECLQDSGLSAPKSISLQGSIIGTLKSEKVEPNDDLGLLDLNPNISD